VGKSAPFLVILSMWIVKMDSKKLLKFGGSLQPSITEVNFGSTYYPTCHLCTDYRHFGRSALECEYGSGKQTRCSIRPIPRS